jgi:hypothetical protein
VVVFFGVVVPDWHKCAVLLNLHLDPSEPAAPAVPAQSAASARASVSLDSKRLIITPRVLLRKTARSFFKGHGLLQR